MGSGYVTLGLSVPKMYSDQRAVATRQINTQAPLADPSGRSFLTVRCNGTDRDERVQKRGEPNHHDGNRDGLKCFSAGGLQRFVRSAPASAFPLIDPRTQGKKPSALKVATPSADAGGANSLPKNPVGAVAAPLSRASPLVSAIATENSRSFSTYLLSAKAIGKPELCCGSSRS